MIRYSLLRLAALLALAPAAFAHPQHENAVPPDRPHDHLRPAADVPRENLKWWKGNLHTHTFWSDGDSFPEITVDWYKENGYHFLGLSDHNILSEGQKWVNPSKTRFARNRGERTIEIYLEKFGRHWAEVREVDEEFREWLQSIPANRRPPEEEMALGETLVRLKPLSEFRHLFEEPGRFLMIQSEEISAAHAVHMNVTNLAEFIPPARGEDVLETMQLNTRAVLEQRERTGQPMFPHINHPNFVWAVTAEEISEVEDLSFFEVYNGHPQVNNDGDERRAGMDELWDVVLTRRLAEFDYGLVYGLAVDDAHEYHAGGNPKSASPGRGWVVVRAAFLTPEHIIDAMERGDFYASTGVTIRDFRSDSNSLEIEIEPEEGIEYVTRFIGTRRGFDSSSEPILDDEGKEMRTTRRYSDDVGEILAEVEGTRARYKFDGDELYVRAKVISTKPKERPYHPEETHEVAWIQPVVPQQDDS